MALALPDRRWYRLTPDRLVIGLLAVEGFLLLSEWFHWFAFNRCKGWTVLVAAASVGATLLLMSLWCAAALVFRRRFQYSLRSLLLLVVAVAIVCSWLKVQIERAAKQKEAVEAIKAAGGGATYTLWHNPIWPQEEESDPFSDVNERPPFVWLRELLGDDFFLDVRRLRLNGPKITDACLARLKTHLNGLDRLDCLTLTDAQITDAGLVHLQGLSRLVVLDLARTGISDEGLVHLAGLRQLQSLALTGTRITDEGLVHLEGLRQLQILALTGTRISDEGLVHLKGLGQLQVLDLSGTRVTDRGLLHLKGLRQLRVLNLSGTRVTDRGLLHLEGLSQLETLLLFGPKVTDEGVKKLRQALPKCEIDTTATHERVY
jgi:hypothetical protein